MAETDSISLVAYAAVLRGNIDWYVDACLSQAIRGLIVSVIVATQVPSSSKPQYRDPKYKLVLHGQGRGLNDLKRNVQDPSKVFVAFYRQEVDGKPRYLLINYLPSTISAVLSGDENGRAISSPWNRIYGAWLIVPLFVADGLDNLTENAIIQALTNTDITPPFLTTTTTTMPQSSAWPSQRPHTYDYPPSPSSSHTDESMKQPNSPISKTASKISKLLGRKKKNASHDSSSGDDFAPPPPPPKDVDIYSHPHSVQHTRFMSTQALPSPTGFQFPRQRINSLSEFGVAPPDNQRSQMTLDPTPPTHTPRPYVPKRSFPSKWVRDPSKVVVRDPADLLRQRREAQQLRAQELERANSEEAERQALRARQKEEARRLEEEEEHRKQLAIEEEMSHVKMVKKQMAELERISEEKRRLALEERKRVERERRLEEHKRLEQWRVEQVLMADEAARRHIDLKRKEKQAKRDRIRMFENRLRSNSQVEDLVTGWLTIQTADSLTWKRRFYKCSEKSIILYRDPKDTHRSEEVDLRGRIKALREWDEGEGFDELKAIPNSFGVEFDGEQEPWSIYADTEDEKYKLMGLLYHAGGLDD
ncbi:hypothetical protein ONZ45_g6876 [Pleurotus djamor]|nr:hypothetical protein ONZ45_g6876 [Pleurotus djamor]